MKIINEDEYLSDNNSNHSSNNRNDYENIK